MIFEKHLRYFIKNLFKFPSDVGFPTRVSAFRELPKTYSEFLKLVRQFYVSNPSFISLYQTYGKTKIKEAIVDKIWVDFDSTLSNRILAFNDLCNVADRLINDFDADMKDIFLTYTGSKGYHIFCRNKSIEYKKEDIYYVLSYLTRDLDFADTPLHGDLNRFIRLPGVQRPEKTFCIALETEVILNERKEFHEYFEEFNYDWRKLFSHTTKFLKKRSKSMVGDEERKDYVRTILDEIARLGWRPSKEKSRILFNERSKNKSRDIQDMIPRDSYEKTVDNLLKDLLPKSVYFGIMVPNPTARDRVSFGTILMKRGLTVDDVIMIIETLRWIDYDEEISRYNLEYIKSRYVD